MKKITALLLALALLCVCFAACAEQATADGSPLKLDGLTLNLSAGEQYKIPAAGSGSNACITVMPYAAQGNTSTNYNISVVLPGVSLSAETMRADTSSYKEKMIDGLKASGYQVIEFNMPGIQDIEILGKVYPALVYDMILNFGLGDQHIYMRQYFITDKERAITITSFNEEEMEKTVQLITAELVWED